MHLTNGFTDADGELSIRVYDETLKRNVKVLTNHLTNGYKQLIELMDTSIYGSTREKHKKILTNMERLMMRALHYE